MIGAGPVLAWVMILGFLIVVPCAAAEGVPDGLDAASVGWLVVAGIGNVLWASAPLLGLADRQGEHRRADRLHRGCDRGGHLRNRGGEDRPGRGHDARRHR